jgi:cardiolipin synthase
MDILHASRANLHTLVESLTRLQINFLFFLPFAALAFWQSPSFAVPLWFVLLILLRESLMLLGGIILLYFKKEDLLSPTIWGKLTTFFQILFIVWLFICYFFGWVPAKTYTIILLLLALSSIISFFHYITRLLKAALF